MIAFVHQYWLTILSGVIGIFFIADCIRIELEARRNTAEQTALRVRLIAEAKEREDAYLDLYREVEQRCSARVWDGKGPEDECLVRIILDSSGHRAEWFHVVWLDEDFSEDAESVSHTRAGYYTAGGLEPINDFGTITHYAEVPEVSP